MDVVLPVIPDASLTMFHVTFPSRLDVGTLTRADSGQNLGPWHL